MANPSRRGQSGSEVSSQMQGADYTPFANTHFVLPYGLRFQQAVGQSTITNVSGNGTTVTYTAANNYSAGHQVSIYGVNPVAYNLQNVTVASATSTQFTVTNAATGTYVSGGVVQKTGTTAVTIPAGITFVYAICVGGGGGAAGGGGGAGGVAWGWTLANSSSFIGSGGTNFPTAGGYTRYGNVIAGGGGLGGAAGSNSGILGAGGGGGGNENSGGAAGSNYLGIPGGLSGQGNNVGLQNGGIGSGGGGGRGGDYSYSSASVVSSPLGYKVGNGGNGISGGGGGLSTSFSAPTGSLQIAGNGGSGLVGGGGGQAFSSTGSRTGGNGGNGINILTGVVTTGGTGSVGTGANGAGGGGAGIAGNGSTPSGSIGGLGGYGGGGGGAGSSNTSGGAGLIYLFY